MTPFTQNNIYGKMETKFTYPKTLISAKLMFAVKKLAYLAT